MNGYQLSWALQVRHFLQRFNFLPNQQVNSLPVPRPALNRHPPSSSLSPKLHHRLITQAHPMEEASSS